MAFGKDECAAAQTVHFNASVALEWWCATNATADQNVTNTQKTAMCLTIDRINGTRNRVVKLYTENANEHNRSINPTTAETDEGSSTVVTVARKYGQFCVFRGKRRDSFSAVETAWRRD